MKLDVTQEIQDFSGKAIHGPEGICPRCGHDSGAGDVLTLRDVCVNSLLLQLPNDTGKAEDKLKRYQLASRIHDEDGPDLKAEDVTLLKEWIAKTYNVLVMGRAFEMLDP